MKVFPITILASSWQLLFLRVKTLTSPSVTKLLGICLGKTLREPSVEKDASYKIVLPLLAIVK